MLASSETNSPAGAGVVGASARPVWAIALLLAGLVDLALIDAILLPRWAQRPPSGLAQPIAPSSPATVLTETRPAAAEQPKAPPQTPPSTVEPELPPILFASGSSTLSTSAQETLTELARRLTKARNREVVLTGHTDDVGPEPVNRALSVERARQCRDFLARNGVVAKRVQVQGFASRLPIDSDATESARARNRRVEIHLR